MQPFKIVLRFIDEAFQHSFVQVPLLTNNEPDQ
jgi:hypothetical protein